MKKSISLFVFMSVLGSLLFLPAMSGRAQVSIDLPGGNVNTNTNTAPAFDPLCIQNAIITRDTAIVTAFDTYTASVKTALQTRKDALVAAWGLTDKTARKTALKDAWKKYRETIRAARKDWRDAKRSAWKKFGTDRKACKVSGSSDESAGQGVDETL